MCPREGYTAEAVLDPRVGGSFRIVMKGPQRDYEHIGEYQVVDRPNKLVFTWISDGTERQPTLVTIELFDRGRQCELVLTHERFPKVEKVADHEKGWTEIIERLAKHVAP